jgi:hypothetical protein
MAPRNRGIEETRGAEEELNPIITMAAHRGGHPAIRKSLLNIPARELDGRVEPGHGEVGWGRAEFHCPCFSNFPDGDSFQ